jgi:hypothetical protein
MNLCAGIFLFTATVEAEDPTYITERAAALIK